LVFIQSLHSISNQVIDCILSIRLDFILSSFLPIVAATDASSEEAFCEKVRENIARTLGIELTQFDERDVAELEKRPDLLQRRYGK
jgi:hypothetical protein